MTILQIHNRYLSPGGEDIVVEAEKRLLESRGHTVVSFIEDNKNLVHDGPIKSVCNTVWSSSSVQKLERLVNKTFVDVAHVHNTFVRLSPAIYHTLKRKKIPVVQTLHNYRFICANAVLHRNGNVCEECVGRVIPLPAISHACYHDSRIQSTVVTSMLATHGILKTWKSKIDVYVALSLNSRAFFIKAGFPEDRIRVKPNFVNPVPECQTEEGRYGIYVGRLVPEKGILTMLEAIRNLPQLPIRIIGDGPLKRDVADYIARHSLDNIEVRSGLTQKQVHEQIRGAFCLIFPTEWHEPFGSVMIESLACSVPVIGSNIGAVPEIIQDGKTGLLFEPRRPESLLEKIQWALDHRTELRRMGLAGRVDFEQKYTSATNYTSLMDIYHDAIEHSRTEVSE